MRIAEIKYHRFTIPFKTKFSTSQLTLSEREGLIIEIVDEYSDSSFGEFSPLPGFSLESIDDAVKGLEAITPVLIGMSVSEVMHITQDSHWDLHKIPSLLFGIEQALFNAERDLFESRLSNYNYADNIQLLSAGLVGTGEISDRLKKIEGLYNSGFRTIKLKAGADSFEKDLELLQSIHEKFGEDLNLRIDINGSWKINEAVSNLKKLERHNIEFVEQPVESGEELIELAGKTGISIAPDESIAEYRTGEEYLNHPNIDTIVIKPMMIGFINTINLIMRAEELKKKVVISSLFEGPIGYSGILYLAALSPNTIHGLGTREFFNEDFSHRKYKSDGPRILFNPNGFIRFPYL